MSEPEKVDPAKLTSLLECAICLQPYDNPVVLPCLHSFCCGCLETHVSATKGADGQFECPSCRDKCPVPKEGVGKFPKNFFANSLKDVVPSSVLQESTAGPGQCKTVPQCDHHRGQKLDSYCKTCEVAVCPCCFMEKHNGHEWVNISVMADLFKEDLQDIAKLAAKRLHSLQQISRDLNIKNRKMEEELDQASKDISDTKESMHSLIDQHAATLQTKVDKAREDARKYFSEAHEGVKAEEENVVKVESCAQALYAEADQFTFRTAAQVPGIKQQFLQQQQVSVPSIQWSMNTKACEPGPVTTPSHLGNVEMKTNEPEVKNTFEVEKGELGPPLQTTRLHYTGKTAICGIATLNKTLLCVSHSDSEYIWVYDGDGELKKKICIPDVDNVNGMAVLGVKQGRLAIVDGKESSLHLVTLSQDMEVQHTSAKVPFVPSHIGKTSKSQVIVWTSAVKKCAIFSADGMLLKDIQLDIPGDQVKIMCVAETPAGYVVCDRARRKVFFTDIRGGLLHTSSYCHDPWYAVHTSWGYVLATDFESGQIIIFTESGELLGNLQDTDFFKISAIQYASCILLDEAERLLYIGCGGVGAMKVRSYKLHPTDLPPLPMKLAERKLEMSVKLAKV